MSDKRTYYEINRQVIDSLPGTVYTGPVPEYGHRVRNSVLSLVTRVAAILFIPLAVWFAASVITRARQTREPVSFADSEVVRTYEVNPGVRGSIVLPDGTEVTLNSGSSLKYSDDFGNGKRLVSLEGEGFFNVAKDKSSPFFITTSSDVTIKVTGTSFNVSCYQDEPFSLVLYEGSVELLRDDSKSIVISPNEEVVIRGDVSSVSPAPVKVMDRTVAWMDGILVFDNASMREVLQKLERWYGVHFIVTDDKVYENIITAQFKSEPLSDVLELVRLTSSVDYSVDGSEITLSMSK